MKKLFFILFVSLVTTFLFGFSVNDGSYSLNQFKEQLKGKWQLILISTKDGEQKFSEFSECHKKDYVEYKDSVRVFVTYETYKTGCSKVIKTEKFKFMHAFNEISPSKYCIMTTHNEDILVLNDSILKMKDYKEVRTYRRMK